MTASNGRHQRVAASFTNQYYTLMVQEPEMLSAFYTQNASFDHMGHRAVGVEEIQAAIKKLYTSQPGASVNIHTLSAVSENQNIHVTIKGSLTAPQGDSYNFTHEVELMEHETQPGSFGIVSDEREKTVCEETSKRWALETPPMFAKEPAANAMERIEQPAATTAVAPVEKTPAKKAEVPAAAKNAANNVSAAAASQSAAKEELNEATGAAAAAQLTSPQGVEAKRPKSFAEAIMAKKCPGGAQQTHATPLMVLAKASKEQPATAEAKDKKGPAAHVAEKNGTKNVPKTGAAAKKWAAAPTSGESEGKNGALLAASSNSKESHASGSQQKRKDFAGRTPSRFVVFYDIIVKGLPTDATEQTVRDIVDPSAPTKLVKLVSRNDKKDPSIMRTFAFVQLDHDAVKSAGGDLKATVAKVIAASKGRKGPGGQHIQVDEVREKYTAAPNAGAVETKTSRAGA